VGADDSDGATLIVGLFVGAFVGELLGAFDGAFVGAFVGRDDGGADGLVDGVEVGGKVALKSQAVPNPVGRTQVEVVTSAIPSQSSFVSPNVLPQKKLLLPSTLPVLNETAGPVKAAKLLKNCTRNMLRMLLLVPP